MADCDQWMLDARANCNDCDFSTGGKNAQGLAAQHAEKYGHSVSYELYYGGTAKPEGTE